MRDFLSKFKFQLNICFCAMFSLGSFTEIGSSFWDIMKGGDEKIWHAGKNITMTHLESLKNKTPIASKIALG